MSVNGIISNAFAANGSVPSRQGSANPEINALEKKLRQLNKEKKEADQSHDTDKVRELEKEIQATEQKLERLKKQEAQNKQKEEEEQKKKPNDEDGQTITRPMYPRLNGIRSDGTLLGTYLNRLA